MSDTPLQRPYTVQISCPKLGYTTRETLPNLKAAVTCLVHCLFNTETGLAHLDEREEWLFSLVLPVKKPIAVKGNANA